MLRTAATAVAILSCAAIALTGQQRPAGYYRPGAHFPPGFPLQGTVKLLSAPEVEMGARTRVRVEYTVGKTAVEPGMAIEIWKHFTSDVEEFQVTDPQAPAYFSAALAPASKATARPVKWTNWEQRNTPPVFPYRKCAGIALEQGALREGDKVVFDLGGEQGVRMQYYEENLFNFRIAITREGRPVAYAGDANLRVRGGALAKLRVQAPSVVKVDEAFPLEVVPMDEWVSLAHNGSGLTLQVEPGAVSGGAFRYEDAVSHYIARDVKASRAGVVRIGVRTADGRVRGVSNPIRVERDPLRRVYYGELHQHTYLADGRGVFDELYRYGRSVGLLDFGAVTPHHMPLSVTGPLLSLGKDYPVEEWPELKRVTKAFNGWQDFVSLSGYEYSVGTEAGGHHNVFYNADDAPSVMQLNPSKPMAPVGEMLRTLQLARVPTLVIPHIGGAPPDWSHPTDPRVERLFEVASVHGVFEESWLRHLKHGLRLGVIGAGDTHTTSMGIAYPGLIYVNANGLAGVYAFGKSRQSIWDGLLDRRTFATTGNTRMLVDFQVNGEPMGGEIGAGEAASDEARVEARISGTAPLTRIDLIKNGTVIHTVAPARRNGQTVRIVWGDNIYQRRAATGLRKGSLRTGAGSISLLQPVNLDQGFESVRQAGASAVEWETAAVSGDRDGMLVDIGEARGELRFRLDDSGTMGLLEVNIPLDALRRDGVFTWSATAAGVRHAYMEKMGVAPRFQLECELVDAGTAAPMDAAFTYRHREPLKPGDYFFVRAEQMDTNKAWSSPVWVN